MTADESGVTVECVTGERRYHKRVELPQGVDPKSAKSSYKNGILEITLKLKKKGDGGVPIQID